MQYTATAAADPVPSLEAEPRTAAHAARGPVCRGERALAPDLARGVMLLFIALANAGGVVFGAGGAGPDPRGLERALDLVMATLVHGRAYPVFAIMFGYGLVQLARRQRAAGATPGEVRSILYRRHAWLIAFGAIHALLLYYGDFLGAYGIIGLLATLLLLDRGGRVDRAVLWLWGLSAAHALALGGVVAWRLATGGAAAAAAAVPTDRVASLAAPTYLASLVARVSEWPIHTATVVPAIVIVWLGMWAAKRRMLEDLAVHARTLAVTAVACLGIAVTGGLPLGLAAAGVLHADEPTLGLVRRLHEVSGMFGGPGYAAALGLLALVVSRAPRESAGARMAAAVGALGQRSLSAYLCQSIAWLVLLAPYTLRLGDRWGSPLPAALGIAALVWLATLAAAVAMDRRSLRGPAETVLRRLTYGAVVRAASVRRRA